MVGTPCISVSRSRRIKSNVRGASKRSCSTRVAPAVMVTATTCTPKMVNSGTAPSTRSSPVWATASPEARAVKTTLRCDSATPFGLPQLVLELVDTQRGVERNQHGAACSRGQESHHPLRPVRQIDRQPIARLYAQPAQRIGERQSFPRHLRIAHPA